MTREFSIANIQKRLIAFIIDFFVIIIMVLAIFYTQLMEIASHLPAVMTSDSIKVFEEEMNQFSIDNILFIIALKMIYHTFFIWQNGMTLGKYFLKIKVIDVDTNQKPSFAKSLLRSSIRIVSEVFFYVGFIVAFFSPRKQTLHDKMSQCVVVDV